MSDTQVQAQEQGKMEGPKHPLLHRELVTPYSWKEWMERFEAATGIPEIIGLLHLGFTVGIRGSRYDGFEYDEGHRLAYYLTIADGWSAPHLLRLSGDPSYRQHVGFENGRSVEKYLCEVRADIALKAFEMLCLNFFRLGLRDENKQKFDYRWVNIVTSERLFPIIQHFFRIVDSVDRPCILNLSNYNRKSNNENKAVDFLLNLAQFVWDWEEPNPYIPEDERGAYEKAKVERLARLNSAKPWLIEVLACLGKLDFLDEYQYLMGLDKSCLAKLKEIALRAELRSWPFVRDSRKVATIEESCVAGSEAAWLLVKHSILKRESARLKTALDAERALEAAQRRVKELGSKR